MTTEKFLDEVASYMTVAKIANMEIAMKLIEDSSLYKTLCKDADEFKTSLDSLRRGMKGTDTEMWMKSVHYSSLTKSSEMVYISTVTYIFAQRHSLYRIHNDNHRAAVTYIYFQTLQDTINKEFQNN